MSESHKKRISEANKGRVVSETTRKKMSMSLKGRKITEETKRKMSLSSKGQTSWNKGKKGVMPEPWNKGKKTSEATKRKLSEAGKGRKHSEITKRKISESNKGKNKGKKISESTKEKIRKANTGKKHSKETKTKQSESHKGKKNPMYGETSPNKGKKTTKEIRDKIRKTLTGFKHTEASKKKMREKIVSEETKEKLKKIANTPKRIQLQREIRARQKFPSKDSKIELQTQKILTDAGIEFEKHVAIKYTNRYHQADILIRPNKIIEVNGYYHFDPRIYDSKQEVRMRNKTITPKKVWDAEKLMLNHLRKLGYEILVVWDWDLKKDLEKITKKILKFAKA